MPEHLSDNEGPGSSVQAPLPGGPNHARYDRSDVSKPGRHRNAKAVVILLVVLCVLGGIGWYAWTRANADSSMGDHDLSAALTQTTQVASTGVGAAASGDSFSNILVLTVDDPEAASPTLEGVHLLVLDTTAQKACLATLPADLLLTSSDGSTQTLRSLYASEGASACIVPISQATSASLSHAVVMSSDSWSELWDLLSSGASAQTLLSKATGLISSMRTDMDATSLIDLFQQVNGVGRANISTYEAEGTTQGEGTSVDAQVFGLAVGTLVAEG
jgi:hypothetical protein